MSAPQLLYKHTKPRRILLMKAFAVTQAFAWSYMAYVTYDLGKMKKTVKKTKLNEDAGTFDKITKVVGESSLTTSLSWFCVGAGFAMTLGAVFWCRQSIKTMHLLNRNRINISTYGFSKENSFTIPIADVQSVNPGASPSYIRLRVVGEPVQFIVDRDGTFPTPKLFHAVTAPSFTSS